MNTIIFTFDQNININAKPAKYRQLIRFYRTAIQKAKQLNYEVELYSNSEIFEKDVDILHWVDADEFNYEFWDSFKFKVLEERYDDYLLCDGDILFHDRINIDPSADIIFDAWETFNWNDVYKEEVQKLTDLGIQSIIPEWINLTQHVMNCGILKFQNHELQKIYVDRWKKVHNFALQHKDKLNFHKCTCVAAQYLLTILSNYYNAKRVNYSTELRIANPFYVHFAGNAKYQGIKTFTDKVTKI